MKPVSESLAARNLDVASQLGASPSCTRGFLEAIAALGGILLMRNLFFSVDFLNSHVHNCRCLKLLRRALDMSAAEFSRKPHLAEFA